MSAGTFALSVILLCAVIALPPLVYARHRGTLSAALIALPFAPAVALEVGLASLNGPAQIGWAFVIYPFLCFVACIVLLYGWVFLGRRPATNSTKAHATLLLAIACVGAFAFGVVAPPWYE